MVNQVGSPAIFDGNMFLPDTGMPIWKIDRINTLLAVWLPEPFTVATWIEKSFSTEWAAGGQPACDMAAEDIDGTSQAQKLSWPDYTKIIFTEPRP